MYSFGDFLAKLSLAKLIPVFQQRGPPRLLDEQKSTYTSTQPQNLFYPHFCRDVNCPCSWLLGVKGLLMGFPTGSFLQQIPSWLQVEPELFSDEDAAPKRVSPASCVFIRGPAECNHQLWWVWFQHSHLYSSFPERQVSSSSIISAARN